MLRQRMLTDEQWAKIEPLLPKLKNRGRPWRESRQVVEGILWILRTGEGEDARDPVQGA
jgi:transposase